MDSIFQGNRSTLIEMALISNGREYKVSRSCRGHLMLSEENVVKPGPAVLQISVDGEITEHPFEIGNDSHGKKVSIAEPLANHSANETSAPAVVS